MNLITKLDKKLSDPLLTFKLFERCIALFCILMPAILWLADGKMPHAFRPSISNYVMMERSYLYGMLLCIAAMLFIFNGAVYYKADTNKSGDVKVSKHGKWYNVVLGLSLIGVICFHHVDYPKTHIFFAILFFLGNAVVTAVFYKDKDKKKSIALAILTVIAMPLAFFNVISILAAEWVSLTVIAIHFYLSTIDMKDPVNYKSKV